MLPSGLLALAILLAGTGAARADPISAAILTFVGIGATSTAVAITTFVLTTAASIGLSLLARALEKPPAVRDPGIQFEVEIGDDSPIGFTVGRTATAGTRKYSGTWGTAGKTPNAYLTDVIQIGDIPAPGQPGLWVNRTKATVLWGETPTAQGYPVEEFRVGGKDHLWVHYRDGTETTADSFLLATFGSTPDRAWQSNMIGRGCPHVIVTALVNRELFPGQMQWLFEPPPTPWYDVRLDDTAGGEGDHRWDDPATWEPTDNPIVIAYNIIRGVYYGDEWVFGGQDLPAFRLPAANWMAAANECDTPVELAGGGTEKQFRCGMEIRGDMEPLAVVEELLKACNGRLAEVGGIFKVLVGAPGAAVYAFSDRDIVVSKGQSLKPFPTLDETHNAIEATYPEPAEMWAAKDAPARYSDALEEEDGERRLATGVNFAAAPFGVQVQRLMKALIEAERRFRVHAFHLPPEAWLLEPGIDVVSWTSAANGYANKKFLVFTIRGEATRNQFVVLIEIDPADHGWNPATDEEPVSTGFLGPIRPPPQPILAPHVEGTIIESPTGAKRAGALFEWDPDVDDVDGVMFRIRLRDNATPAGVVLEDQTDFWETGALKTSQNLLPNTQYDGALKYRPASARPTTWSGWLPFTTPNVGITEAELDAGMQALLGQLKSSSQAWIGLIREEARAIIENMAAANGGAYAFNEHQINQVASIIGHRVGENEAQIIRADRAIATINSALAEALVNLIATNQDGSAEVLWAMRAAALPEGAIAAVEETLRAGFGGQLAEAARGMEVYAGEGGAFSRLWFRGDRFDIIDGQGVRRNALLFPVADEQDVEITVEGSDNVIRPDLRGRALRHYCLLDDDAELRPPVGAVPMDYTVRVEQDDAGDHEISASDEYLLPKPELSGPALLPGAISIIEHSILSINPLRIAATVSEPFTETPTVAFRAFRQQTTGSTSQQLTTTPVGLNYVPGNAILAICIQHRRSTASPVQPSQVIGANTVDGWAPIAADYGGHSSGGGQHRAIGVRAFLRFADGNEGPFQPFENSGPGTFFTELTTHYYALDFLGGTLSLCDDPTADAGSTDGSTWNHTIKTDGFDPAIAFSVAAIANQSGTEPDQAFSETPDQNRTTFAFGLGNFWLNVRSKVKFFNSEADDVTTSLTAPGGTGVRSLISFGLKME